LDAYRSAVGLALRKSKPPHGRGRGGSAHVVFTIGQSGTVEAAVLKLSSGDTAQDDMAIAAARRTRFPPPDPLLSAAQRTFPAEYQFGVSAARSR
jgi:TonB family protein